MLKRIKQKVNSRFVTKIIAACVLTATVLIILQATVIAVYITKQQEQQALESSMQTLYASKEYFSGLFAKVKTLNTQLHTEEVIRRQMNIYLSKGESARDADRNALQRSISEQLVKNLGVDTEPLIEAYYFDLMNNVPIQIFWSEDIQKRTPYRENAFEAARYIAQTTPNSQRMFEVSSFGETPEASTLTLFDYTRDPDDLTRVTGVLIFHYAVDQITQQLYAMGFNDETEVMLLSQGGALLYDSIHDISGAADLFEDQPLVVGTFFDDGLHVVQYNGRYGFYVISAIEKEALYHEIYSMLFFILVCTFGVLALMIAMLVGVERRVSRRMTNLAEDIAKIESGRLDVVLNETDNNDELDVFAHNINDMQRRLSGQIEREKTDLKRTQQLELMQKDAEFYALQAQIKPHFLYNTLEVIRMRAVTEHATDTATMVRLLADIFRENVNRQTMTTVSEVVNYCERYVELFSYRFCVELIFDVHVEPAARRCVAPTYTLQPIVENALMHGLSADSETPTLQIHVTCEAGDVVMQVMDNGCGMDENTLDALRAKLQDREEHEGHENTATSIGIANVNHRLKMLYGDEYGLSIESCLGEGTTVTIRFPAKLDRGGGRSW